MNFGHPTVLFYQQRFQSLPKTILNLIFTHLFFGISEAIFGDFNTPQFSNDPSIEPAGWIEGSSQWQLYPRVFTRGAGQDDPQPRRPPLTAPPQRPQGTMMAHPLMVKMAPSTHHNNLTLNNCKFRHKIDWYSAKVTKLSILDDILLLLNHRSLKSIQ